MKRIAFPDAKRRRDIKRDLRICINGPLPTTHLKDAGPERRTRIEHGHVVRGGKCQRCIDIATRSEG